VKRKLVSTITGTEYPFERLEEFADNGEALEVALAGIERARPRAGRHLWERFSNSRRGGSMRPAYLVDFNANRFSPKTSRTASKYFIPLTVSGSR
jgi:hypothetical protein